MGCDGLAASGLRDTGRVSTLSSLRTNAQRNRCNSVPTAVVLLQLTQAYAEELRSHRARHSGLRAWSTAAPVAAGTCHPHRHSEHQPVRHLYLRSERTLRSGGVGD